MKDTGIKDEVIVAIREAARECSVSSVVLFGSRARGEYRERSDIDLAISGGDQVRFALMVEENAPTLLEFDFVSLDGPVSEELKVRVAREGWVLYEEVR